LEKKLKNFGVYGTAKRNLVFSVNDFDEVYVGPWEWDLKRSVGGQWRRRSAIFGW
jgi:uncharacterized protein (DUF2252 family)